MTCASRDSGPRLGYLRSQNGESTTATLLPRTSAGDDLFTSLRFPPSQWKALRTTNALERINEEFRRRTKTQASLPSEDSVLLLLFGLLRSGKIRMRKIHGWEELPKRGTPREQAA